MDHVRVVEAAHDVDDGVGLADVRQELVAQPLALRRAGDEARDVDELDGRREGLLASGEGREAVQPRVRHADDAHVGLDGAERVVGRLGARVREGVEERGLADVGQTDDADAEGHTGRGMEGWREE